MIKKVLCEGLKVCVIDCIFVIVVGVVFRLKL